MSLQLKRLGQIALNDARKATTAGVAALVAADLPLLIADFSDGTLSHQEFLGLVAAGVPAFLVAVAAVFKVSNVTSAPAPKGE